MDICANTVHEIFDRFHKKNPYPEGELEYNTPYTLLVAVILSAQSTDKSVNIATRPLFSTIKTPAQMIDFGLEKLTFAIRSIGLYKTKARNIILMSHRLIDNFNSELPTTRNLLETLPGVGRKTANVVMNILWQEPCMPVDTHVFRVSHRLGLSTAKSIKATEEELMAIIPDRFLVNAHHWLILHGRYICKSKKPLCESCFLADVCKTKNLS